MNDQEYRNLSNEDLTILFLEKCPDVWFLVDDSNRNLAIACLKIAQEQKDPTMVVIHSTSQQPDRAIQRIQQGKGKT